MFSVIACVAVEEHPLFKLTTVTVYVPIVAVVIGLVVVAPVGPFQVIWVPDVVDVPNKETEVTEQVKTVFGAVIPTLGVARSEVTICDAAEEQPLLEFITTKLYVPTFVTLIGFPATEEPFMLHAKIVFDVVEVPTKETEGCKQVIIGFGAEI